MNLCWYEPKTLFFVHLTCILNLYLDNVYDNKVSKTHFLPFKSCCILCMLLSHKYSSSLQTIGFFILHHKFKGEIYKYSEFDFQRDKSSKKHYCRLPTIIKKPQITMQLISCFRKCWFTPNRSMMRNFIAIWRPFLVVLRKLKFHLGGLVCLVEINGPGLLCDSANFHQQATREAQRMLFLEIYFEFAVPIMSTKKVCKW